MKGFLSSGGGVEGCVFFGLRIIALVALQRSMKFMNNAIE